MSLKRPKNAPPMTTSRKKRKRLHADNGERIPYKAPKYALIDMVKAAKGEKNMWGDSKPLPYTPPCVPATKVESE